MLLAWLLLLLLLPLPLLLQQQQVQLPPEPLLLQVAASLHMSRLADGAYACLS